MGLQATVVRDIILGSASYGAAYDQLCAFAGFTQEELSDSKLMVEWEKAARIWDVLADITGDEQIGLLIGSEMSISMNGMVGFLMQSSKTVEQAIEVFCKFGYMVCPMVRFEYKKAGADAILELHQSEMWKAAFPRNARLAMDFTFACIIHFSRQLAGKTIYPRRVDLEFARQAVDAYRGLFRCDVRFDAVLYRLVFRREDLQAPVLTSDRSLYETFNGILSQQKTLLLQSNCSNALKQTLIMYFKGRIPAMGDAAEAMNMTVRTLQRKLAEEGTSFRAIAAEVKKEMSLHLMKHAAANITEVAGIMGYSDLPAFRKAFKSWTRETPRQVKRQIKAPLAAAI